MRESLQLQKKQKNLSADIDATDTDPKFGGTKFKSYNDHETEEWDYFDPYK
jgi:hypothetical protein